MGNNKIARTTKFSGYADFEMRSKINENLANIVMIYHQFSNWEDEFISKGVSWL